MVEYYLKHLLASGLNPRVGWETVAPPSFQCRKVIRKEAGKLVELWNAQGCFEVNAACVVQREGATR